MYANLKSYCWFDNGKLNADILGAPEFSLASGGTSNSSSYISDKYLYIGCNYSTNGKDSALFTSAKVPIGVYKSVTIKMSTIVRNGVHVGFFTSKSYGTPSITLKTFSATTSTDTYTLDLSNYNTAGGALYFGVYADISEATIYEVVFNK